MNKLWFLIFIVIFSFCCIPKQKFKETAQISSEGEYITVVSEGIADIRDAGISEAIDRACLDAQHKAIEKALGKIYSARTIVESGRFIEQAVMANVKGYIRKWYEISKPEEIYFPGTNEKVVCVKICAEVGLDKLKNDTLALQELQKRLGRPDVLVSIDNIYAKQVITTKLQEMGFTVRNLEVKKDSDLIKLAIENNIEIIISGNVSVKNAGEIMEGLGMKSFQSQVDLQAINVSDGKVIAHTSAQGAYPHIEEESGKSGAVKRATESAINKLVDELLTSWENILNNGNELYLKIKGLPIDQESNFRKLIERSIRGCKEIYCKGMKDDVVSYKVLYLGNVNNLAKDLGRLRGVNVKVISCSTNIVEAEIIKERR
jgi:hypothetical protein